MNSEGVVVQVDHPVLGTARGTAFQINKLIVSIGTFLVPLFIRQSESDDNNNTNGERFMVLLKDFIGQINKTLLIDSSMESASTTDIKFKVISQHHIPKEIQLCFLHSYTKLVPEDILNWNSYENTDDSNHKKLMLEASQLFMYFTKGNTNIKSIKHTLMDVYTKYRKNIIYPGLPVLVESTPFANISFLNSWSHGIVSKVLEHGNGGIVIDARLVYGCEGAPIYVCDNNVKGDLIGVVIQTMSWCNGEWVGFSLGLSIKHLLEDVFRLTPTYDYIPFNKLPLELPMSQVNYDKVSGSVVFVRCGHKWGSGIIIDADNVIILTCSHVVHHSPNSVWVKHSGVDYPATVVYSTPPPSPFDLAVLIVKHIPRVQSLSLADKPPVLGERVYTAGYPLSTESLVNLDSLPTLSAGVVSKVSSRGGPLQTTCCTQSGVSGGALVRPPDQLLGIVVSNIKLHNTTLPDFCFAVNAQDIKQTVHKYLETKDPSCLQHLSLKNTAAKMEWALMDSKL